MVRFLIICCVLLFSSCMDWVNREVEINMPSHTPRIVLNSLLVDGDEQIRLRITQSVGMKESIPMTEGLRNAHIRMNINGNSVEGLRFMAGDNEYRVDHPISAGDKVEVSVDVPGFNSVSSSTSVPHPSELLSARFGSANDGMGSVRMREVFFRIKDIVDDKKYYILKFAQESETTPLRTAIQLRSNIQWIVPIYPFNVGFESTAFQGESMEFQVLVNDMYFSGNNPDMESYLILETVDKPYYDYQTAFYYHRNGQRPELFGGEPTPMPTNIINGFGVFGGASRHMIRIE
ncbi:MAG TPA: DUF4249 domain-containing protein [Anditalea sp.]|nr:DUF4249 domain-containing protein [Anditalea sp.]